MTLGSNPSRPAMKQCCICKETKPFTEFDKARNIKDGYQRYCKLCRKNVVTVRHYAKRKDHILEREYAKRKRQAQQFKEWKSNFKCAMCPEDEVVSLDFHHLNPSEKEFELSKMMLQYSLKRLQEEAKKCIVVCKNCHAKIHAGLVCVWPKQD